MTNCITCGKSTLFLLRCGRCFEEHALHVLFMRQRQEPTTRPERRKRFKKMLKGNGVAI